MYNRNSKGLKYDLELALKGYRFPFLGAYVPQYNYCWFISSGNVQLEEIMHYLFVGPTPAAFLPALKEIADPFIVGPIVGVEEYRNLVEAIYLAYTMTNDPVFKIQQAWADEATTLKVEHHYTPPEKEIAKKLVLISQNHIEQNNMPVVLKSFVISWLSQIVLHSFPYPEEEKVTAYSMFYDIAYEDVLAFIEKELKKRNKEWFNKLWNNFYISIDPHSRLRIALLILKWLNLRFTFISEEKEGSFKFKYLSPLINSFFTSFLPIIIVNLDTDTIKVDMSREKIVVTEKNSHLYYPSYNILELTKRYPNCIYCQKLRDMRHVYFDNNKTSIKISLQKILECIIDIVDSLKEGDSCDECRRVMRTHFNSSELMMYEVMIREYKNALDSYVSWLEEYLEGIGHGLLTYFQNKEKVNGRTID